MPLYASKLLRRLPRRLTRQSMPQSLGPQPFGQSLRGCRRHTPPRPKFSPFLRTSRCSAAGGELASTANCTIGLIQQCDKAGMHAVSRGGACIPPAGAERLPAGLSPTLHPPRKPMSERRGRRRTRLNGQSRTIGLIQQCDKAGMHAVSRGGACIPPAGAERLPAGLSPTLHPPRMPMSERRGRRRTRLNVMLHHRAHSAMRRSRKACPAPRHEQNSLYRTQLTVSHQKRLMILYSVSRCAASLPAPSMSRTIFLVDMS